MKKFFILLIIVCLSLFLSFMIVGCKGSEHVWKLENQIEPTCTTTGVTNYRCEKCGEKKTVIIPVDQNQHEYGGEWKNDFAYHWQEIVCGHADSTLKKVEHNFDGESCSICAASTWQCAIEHAKSQKNFTKGTNITVSIYYGEELYGEFKATEDMLYLNQGDGEEIWFIYENDIYNLYVYDNDHEEWFYERTDTFDYEEFSIEYLVVNVVESLTAIYNPEKDVYVDEEIGVNVNISKGKIISVIYLNGEECFFEYGNTEIEIPELKKQQDQQQKEEEQAKAKWAKLVEEYKDFANTQVRFVEGTNLSITIQRNLENYSYRRVQEYDGVAWYSSDDLNYYNNIYIIKTEEGYLYHGKSEERYGLSTYIMNEEQKEKFDIKERKSALSYFVELLESATFVEYLGKGEYIVDFTHSDFIGRVKVSFSDGKLSSILEIDENSGNSIMYSFTYGDVKIEKEAIISWYENITAFSEFTKTQKLFEKGTNFTEIEGDTKTIVKDNVYYEETPTYREWIIKENEQYTLYRSSNNYNGEIVTEEDIGYLVNLEGLSAICLYLCIIQDWDGNGTFTVESLDHDAFSDGTQIVFEEGKMVQFKKEDTKDDGHDRGYNYEYTYGDAIIPEIPK